MFQTFLIALGLSADAFAVAAAAGVSQKKIAFRQAFSMAFAFGFFQAAMPVLGYFLGSAFKNDITAFDHWIAFGLLAFIGGKMAYEGWFHDETESVPKNVFAPLSLLTLAVATSIDALAVGLSYAVMGGGIFLPAAIIGITTFVLSFAAVEFGKRLGSSVGARAEIIGGLILIGIGTKILVEHLGIL